MQNPECIAFVASESFKNQFYTILQHDREIFEEPKEWQTKSIYESPLVNDFSNIWNKIKEKYQTELSALAYRPIPNEEIVAKNFEVLMLKIRD
jgi:hypothetical protein